VNIYLWTFIERVEEREKKLLCNICVTYIVNFHIIFRKEYYMHNFIFATKNLRV